MFPDAPSLPLDVQEQSTASQPPLSSKPSASKPSAVMQESLKRSLAQAHSQLAHAPSTDKPSAQPQTVAAAAAGASRAAGSSGTTAAPTAPPQQVQRIPTQQDKATLKNKHGTTAAHSPQSLPAAAPCMPQYGGKGREAGVTPASHNPKKQKQNEASEQANKPQCASDVQARDGRLWCASSSSSCI